MKYSLVLKCDMIRRDIREGEEVAESKEIYLSAAVRILTSSDEINQSVNLSIDDLHSQIDSYTSEGSGWIFGRTKAFYIEVADYKPVRGRSYIKLLIAFQRDVF